MDTERDVVPPSATGDSRVDQAIARLTELQETPLDEHPAVLEAVHDRLREILGELGEPGRAGDPGVTGSGGGPGKTGGGGEPGKAGGGEPGRGARQ